MACCSVGVVGTMSELRELMDSYLATRRLLEEGLDPTPEAMFEKSEPLPDPPALRVRQWQVLLEL